MILRTRFSLGDQVYIRKVQCLEKPRVPCKICDGTKIVFIKGISYLCPECKGAGHGPIEFHDRAVTLGPYTVARVTTDASYEGTEIKYMTEDAGCPSGTLWKESQLFETEEEAEA